MKKYIFLVVASSFLLFTSCNDDDLIVEDCNPTISTLTCDEPTTPYNLSVSFNLPPLNIPEDNELTEQGVLLGRMLFYEKGFSKDRTIACASCHFQEAGFSDPGKAVSLGVEERPGTRNAMPLFNLMWHTRGFFWDGRAGNLREQVLMPIQDVSEFDSNLEDVIIYLSGQQDYREKFCETFGDDNVTNERIAKALEQFLLTIISKDSKYDEYLEEEVWLTAAEERGRKLFFTEPDLTLPDGEPQIGADCFHCHGDGNNLFTTNDYRNNGIIGDYTNEADKGLFDVTGDINDIGKFKVPSLRNIALTAPYMHDGRFETLGEVLDFYNNDVDTDSPNLHPLMHNLRNGLNLTDQQLDDLEAFMNTLTDETFLNNPAYSNPF